MNEYLLKLYDWISSQDTTFQDRRSKEEFISKMENDADYNQQMYTWISGVDATFTDRYTSDEFQTKTGLKKKEEPVDSTSPEGGTGSTSQPQEDLGSSEFGQDYRDRVAGIQRYFDKYGDMSAEDVDGDINIQAAIADGVISEQELIDAGYMQPEQVSTLSATTESRAEAAKRKISSLRRKTDQELDIYIDQERLDKPYAFEQSASEDTFVDDLYDSSMLTMMNINVRDFDGFLEERGFKKDFLDKQERGLFKDTYGAGGDPKLSFEIEKMRMLNLYVSEQLNRDIKWQKIQDQKRTGVNPDFVRKDFRPSEKNINTQILSEYVDKEMPYISKVLKERDAQNRAAYKKYINGDMGVGNFLSSIAREGWRGFSDRVGEFSASGYDFVGMDNTADALRLANMVDKVSRPDDLTYGYASGKTVEHNGREYLVDDNNQVYDTRSKIVVTQFLNPMEYKYIVDRHQQILVLRC